MRKKLSKNTKRRNIDQKQNGEAETEANANAARMIIPWNEPKASTIVRKNSRFGVGQFGSYLGEQQTPGQNAD